MKNALQKTVSTQIAALLIMVHLPLWALMPIQLGAHVFEHRTNTHHALAHTVLSCRLACTAFVFMPSVTGSAAKGLSPLFETQLQVYENLYEKVALSAPSIRGPPVHSLPFLSCTGSKAGANTHCLKRKNNY